MSAALGHCLVPCFVCGKEMERVYESEMQPYGGVMCSTSGNFGSTALDGENVVFLVCDDCLRERSGRTRQAITPRIRPETTYTEWPNV